LDALTEGLQAIYVKGVFVFSFVENYVTDGERGKIEKDSF